MIGAVGFAVIAACAVGSAVFVVRSTNLVRAALWLAASLLATAALYAVMGASFLAGAQALLYVGGVVTLLIFGVMLTRRHEGLATPAESAHELRGAAAALSLFGLLAWAIRATDGLDGAPPAAPVTPAALGRAIVVDHVLAFEAVSFLLLGAVIGAAVIARRRDPGEPAASARRGAAVASDAPGEPAAEALP